METINKGRFYLIGDIHGYFEKLFSLYARLLTVLNNNDTIIFLGDYIDRGKHSCEVVEFLIKISKKHNIIFLKGNHEDMLMKYLHGEDKNSIYLINGGDATVRSYKKNYGEFTIPDHHIDFFSSLALYYEHEEFIAVHAGINPSKTKMETQDEHDLMWIRDKFFRANKKFEKTIIFGHTPTSYIGTSENIHNDIKRNIIGIDSGIIFGRNLTCLQWPEKKIFNSE